MAEGKPSVEWDKAKTDFFATTGQKKPREKLAGFFKTSHTGITSQLKTLDALSTVGNKARTTAKFKKEVDKFAGDAKKYQATLKKLIDDEDEKTITESMVSNGKIDTKKIKTDMYRALKILSTSLDRYEAYYRTMLLGYEIADGNIGKLDQVEKKHVVYMKSGFAKFAASAAKIKGKPTAEVYNNEDCARYVTTGIGAYRQLAKEALKLGVELSDDQKRMVARTEKWIGELEEWASGAKRKLNDDAQVMTELKALTVKVKACAADLMT